MKILETERLILSAFQETDLEDFYEIVKILTSDRMQVGSLTKTRRIL